jgi:hypothetical protein
MLCQIKKRKKKEEQLCSTTGQRGDSKIDSQK